MLRLALCYGKRALPLAWRVEATNDAIRFGTQKALLDAAARWGSAPARVRLMGDCLYGTADLMAGARSGPGRCRRAGRVQQQPRPAVKRTAGPPSAGERSCR